MSATKARGRRPAEIPTSVTLVGAPRSLRGELTIANDSDEELFISGPVVHTAAAEQGPVRANGSTVVPGGSSSVLPLSVGLGRHVPPGEYAAHVDIGGERHDVVLRVVEDVDLDVTPHRVYVTPSARGAHHTTIVAANDGNVPVLLPASASATVGDAGTLTMRLGPSATTLDPGQSATLDVTITTPAERDPAMRYDIPLSIGPRDITVVVLPTAADTTTPPTAGSRLPRL